MSRWANDPERAADALIERSLDDIELSGRILLVNQAGAVPGWIRARGLDCAVWNRRVMGGARATPWPVAGPFDTALVRLPKARDEQDMTAHAALSALEPGGRLILYGGNDEGIRSAADRLEEVTGPVETLAMRGHGRVLAARRAPDRSLKDSLASWRIGSTMEIVGVTRDWVTYPGIFAAGRLDEGTALLLGAMPLLPAHARVLDYGCGSGAISATALAAEPTLVLDVLDNDAVALEAVLENVPRARPVLGARVADAGSVPYAAILSNPPLHQGAAEDISLLENLLADAPSHLVPGGILQIVVQHRLPLNRAFAKHFGSFDVIAENSRYRVWRAQKK